MTPVRRQRQQGHVMAALLCAITIMMIFSLIVFQAWEDVLRRENEAEMIFRAQEISRAIFKYRQDRQEVPRALDELLKPGPRGQYYLRQPYRDPLVLDGVWGLLFRGPDGAVLDVSGGYVDPERQLGFLNDEQRTPERDLPGGTFAAEQRGTAGRIVGVKTLSTDQPFRVYKGFTEYSQWQFTYQDYEDPSAGGRPGRRQRQNPRDADLGRFGIQQPP